MRVTYVARTFLDYRVPVFKAIDHACGGGLHVIFSGDHTPERVVKKTLGVLDERALALRGERRLGPAEISGFANVGLRVVYQPGILRAIADTRPDVLIGDGFYQWTSFALAYRIRHGTPLVVCYERTFHTERRAQWIRKQYRRQMLRFVDAMAVNGRLSREYSEWLGMSPARITTGQMVADTDGLARKAGAVTHASRASLRSTWGSPDLVFLVAAQLVSRKGLQELLLGWVRMEREAEASCRLVLIGSGPLETELKDQARALGINGVLFLGHVDYDSVAPYYAAADVFVMPTLEDNWSLVVPEAMACGLPVLCSRYNGCYPELVEPGGNGWVFDPLDERECAESLLRCVAERNRLPEMGWRSKQIVAGHTPAHAADAILNACRLAIAHRAG